MRDVRALEGLQPRAGLAAATLADLAVADDGAIPSKALRRRWRWLQDAVSDRRASGWGDVPMEDSAPAVQRLAIVLSA